MPTWEDYAQDKRQDFDKVLVKAPAEITAGVHEVILKHEHMALGRRFREFALNHLDPSFFRQEAQDEQNPARRCDLPEALGSAYGLRSSYIHKLLALPRILTAAPSYSDVVMIGDSPVLSFHGLARIARHIIHHVVTHASKVEHENFDYRTDMPNTIEASLAEVYWIWQHQGYDQNTARRYLNGFLCQLTPLRIGEIGASLTDIRSIISKIEELVPGLAKPSQRLPLLTLYLLFHQHTPSKYHQPNHEEFFKKYSTDFDSPSVESLIAHLLTGNVPDWSLEQQNEIYQRYFKQRHTKSGLQFGALFEAGVTLTLAEAYRQAEDETRARDLIKEAVENLPKHQQLLEFEETLSSPLQQIDWEQILMPPKSMDVGPNDEGAQTSLDNDTEVSQNQLEQSTLPEVVPDPQANSMSSET